MYDLNATVLVIPVNDSENRHLAEHGSCPGNLVLWHRAAIVPGGSGGATVAGPHPAGRGLLHHFFPRSGRVEPLRGECFRPGGNGIGGRLHGVFLHRTALLVWHCQSPGWRGPGGIRAGGHRLQLSGGPQATGALDYCFREPGGWEPAFFAAAGPDGLDLPAAVRHAAGCSAPISSARETGSGG